MALEIIDDPGDMWGTPAGLSMLPLIEGKRGWNKQGASWSQIASGGLDDEVDPKSSASCASWPAWPADTASTTLMTASPW